MSGNIAGYVFQPVLFHNGSGKADKMTALNPARGENYRGQRGDQLRKIVRARVRQAKRGETDRATHIEVLQYMSDLSLVNSGCANANFVAVMFRMMQEAMRELGMDRESLPEALKDIPAGHEFNDLEEEVEKLRKRHWEGVLKAGKKLRKEVKKG